MGIQERKVDIAFGSFNMNSRLIDFSIPYHSSKFVFRVPLRRSLTFLEKLYKPFSYNLWMSFGGLMFFLIITIFITRKFLKPQKQAFILGSRVTSPYMNVLRLTLTGSISTSQVPGRNFARFILTLFLLFFIIVQSAYTGSLFRFVKRDIKIETPQTIAEMIEQNYTFYMNEHGLDQLRFWKEVFDRRKIFSTNEELFAIANKLSTVSDEKLTISDGLDRILFQNNLLKKKINNFCPETIYSYPRSIGFQHNSPLTNRINEILLKFSENGFLEKARRDYIINSDYVEIEQTKQLTLNSLFEVSYIVVGGWVLSFVVLIIEKVYNFVKLRKLRFQNSTES